MDYRETIAKLIDQRKRVDSKKNHTRIAEALRIQKTYVSRVMRKQAHFHADQLFSVCEFLKLSEDETAYLLLLLEYERASSPGRKKMILGQIHRLQTDRKKFEKSRHAKMLDPAPGDPYADYYLEPRAPLIHMYMTIPEYRQNPPKIKADLGVSERQFKKVLALLERLDIIRWNPTKKYYDLLIDHLHLRETSPLSFPSEQLTRMMSIEHMKRLSEDQRFCFSLTFSADAKTRAFVHEEFLKFLRRSEAVIQEAPAEAVYHLAFDLFPWKVTN
jgi:uncharacterized protein (TIGR02147 family)